MGCSRSSSSPSKFSQRAKVDELEKADTKVNLVHCGVTWEHLQTKSVDPAALRAKEHSELEKSKIKSVKTGQQKEASCSANLDSKEADKKTPDKEFGKDAIVTVERAIAPIEHMYTNKALTGCNTSRPLNQSVFMIALSLILALLWPPSFRHVFQVPLVRPQSRSSDRERPPTPMALVPPSPEQASSGNSSSSRLLKVVLCCSPVFPLDISVNAVLSHLGELQYQLLHASQLLSLRAAPRLHPP